MLSRPTVSIIAGVLFLLTILSPGLARAQLDDSSGAMAVAGANVAAIKGTVFSGGPAVTLPIEVTNVQKLGAATVAVSFDPAVIKVASCQRSPAFDAGLCNPYDSNGDGKADQVLFNALSLAGVSTGASPVVIANISWQAATAVGAETSALLHVQIDTFTDVEGKPLEAATQDGSVVVLPAKSNLLVFLPFVHR